MKTTLSIILTFIIPFVCYSQSSSNTNSYSTGVRYIGWDATSNYDLDIVNDDNNNINFYTNGGSGSPWANMRMRIAAGGNIGIGTLTTPRSLFHIHSDAADCRLQMTTNNTGTATNAEGFRIDINSTNDQVNIRQFENASMRFHIRDLALNTDVRRAEFTYGQAMIENQAGTNRTDGLRIWNPGYLNSTTYAPEQALDLWCGESNTTHISGNPGFFF